MRYILFALSLFVPVVASAQGAITLGTPITAPAPPAIASYVPKALTLETGAAARIVITLVSNDANAREIHFEYPRDCGSFGATLVNGLQVPNPPTCPNLDTSAEVATLIGQLNTANLSTRSLWRRVFDRLVADFPARFNGGGTVQ